MVMLVQLQDVLLKWKVNHYNNNHHINHNNYLNKNLYFIIFIAFIAAPHLLEADKGASYATELHINVRIIINYYYYYFKIKFNY